ncbi:hypothetical protein C8Q70DRAFT_371072 [Cubamyces menziesii]|nr:hypothetical protein C8Q70DRAFT_371072 [Cubamyces menziesii]
MFRLLLAIHTAMSAIHAPSDACVIRLAVSPLHVRMLTREASSRVLRYAAGKLTIDLRRYYPRVAIETRGELHIAQYLLPSRDRGLLRRYIRREMSSAQCNMSP